MTAHDELMDVVEHILDELRVIKTAAQAVVDAWDGGYLESGDKWQDIEKLRELL